MKGMKESQSEGETVYMCVCDRVNKDTYYCLQIRK